MLTFLKLNLLRWLMLRNMLGGVGWGKLEAGERVTVFHSYASWSNHCWKSDVQDRKEDSTVVELCRHSVYRQILEIAQRMAP